MQVKALAAAVLVAASSLAQAGVIVGGSTLLNSGYQSQLENWLGQGPLTLSNIFTKDANDTSYDFHDSVNGKGATFSVMKVSVDGINWEIIGGYAPNSWTNSPYHFGAYWVTNDIAERTGFLFNLTDSVKWAQSGALQAFHKYEYGPTFGSGHDLYVDSSLTSGYSSAGDYISAGSNIFGTSNLAPFQVRELEVFAIGPGTDQPIDVPEPGSLALFGLGLLGLSTFRRRAHGGSA